MNRLRGEASITTMITSPSRTSDRLVAARERRMLEDSAIVAVDGGVLLSLDADLTETGLWHADVLRGDGAFVRVRLDLALGTAEMVAAEARPPGAMAA